MQKDIVLDELLRVFWGGIYTRNDSNVTLDKRGSRPFIKNEKQNAFFNSIIGYNGELKFSVQHQQKHNALDGGWFVPVSSKQKNPLSNCVYFTVTSMPIEQYEPLYKLLSAIPDIKLYICQIPSLNKEFADHIHPALALFGSSYNIELVRAFYSVYVFGENGEFVKSDISNLLAHFDIRHNGDNSETFGRDLFSEAQNEAVLENAKELLKPYSCEELYSLWANRYLYDFVLSQNRWKGRTTDIDFIKCPDEASPRFNFIDVKNKTRDKGMVGHNADHIQFWNDLEAILKDDQSIRIKISYVLYDRDNSNVTDHWMYTDMSNFTKFGQQRGGNKGRNSTKASKTLMLMVDKYFKDLSE
ncbi:hypothetical protein [Kordiimonas laminariae]|uniref:hypothetical protein n=1 Tax=Kordiimonas laminariae TaxID=2917717 RepID=UPI001FF17662|nr:hypothetical protein [Kordiimonas laminariae]MCK0070859.1 hypothetical protein [Kordiimonas laminariae]